MKCSKKEIGEALLNKLNKGFSIHGISNWAEDLFISMRESSELDSLLRQIFVMDAGPEFECKEKELRLLANKLIDEGKRDELSKPIIAIKDTALKLESNWLMCPLCQEAWENQSEYAMVCCPKCNNKLHNPSFENRNN